MIMADKIIEQRKKNGWSQEELAEKLQVSRQSVSKWEGAQSIPDLSKVVAMASLFDVSTDYLLKDDIEQVVPEQNALPQTELTDDTERRVSMEEANAFLTVTGEASKQIPLGVSLCILSPIFVIMLSAAGVAKLIPLTEDEGGIFGSIIMMLIIAGAVALFVKNGMRLSKYGYLEEELIDTEYGVTGMVKERKQGYEHTHLVGMTGGIILCVLSSVPILAGALVGDKNIVLAAAGVCLGLAMIAFGVYHIVRVSIIWGGYQKLLEEGDYARKTKKSKNGLVAGIYWSIMTAIYLGYSFLTMDWHKSWIIWPVAGVLYAAVIKIEEYRLKNR